MSENDLQSMRSEILGVLRSNGDPFMTATEVADEVGATRQNVKYHLDRLQEDGEVDRKEAGSRAVGWWAV